MSMLPTQLLPQPLPPAVDPVTGLPPGQAPQFVVPPQPQPVQHLPVQQLPPMQVPPQQIPPMQQPISDFGPGVTPPTPVYVGEVQPITAPQQLPPVQLVPAPGMTAPQGFVPLDQVQALIAQATGQARTDEKTKLYERLQGLDGTVNQLEAERQARIAAEQATAAAEAARQRAVAEQGMDAKQLVEQRTAELQASVAGLANQLGFEQALRQKEAQLAALEVHKRNVLTQIGEYVMPELRDFIMGDTPEAIDASAQEMINKTAVILGNVQQNLVPQVQPQPLPQGFPAPGAAQQPPLYDMRGVAPTGAAPVGPLEQAAATQVMDPGTIRAMGMAEYRQHRDRLLGAAAQSYYAGMPQG